jgi:hypothetical protein
MAKIDDDPALVVERWEDALRTVPPSNGPEGSTYRERLHLSNRSDDGVAFQLYRDLKKGAPSLVWTVVFTCAGGVARVLPVYARRGRDAWLGESTFNACVEAVESAVPADWSRVPTLF